MSNFKVISDENGEKYSLFKDGNLLCNLIKIPEGTFLREDGKMVKVNSFYLGEFPVTQELYWEVTGLNPSRFQGEDRPVETVNWYEAVEFCDILTREVNFNPRFYDIDKTHKDKNNKSKYDDLKWIVNFNKGGKGFRLPTEAEWEFVAKEGSEPYKPYSGGKFLDPVGWYEANNNYETKPVGLKYPNKLGLYDMSGNVWEWCYDWYAEYDTRNLENPVGAILGTDRVYLGGGWFNGAVRCLSEYRLSTRAGFHFDYLGFRLVFVR